MSPPLASLVADPHVHTGFHPKPDPYYVQPQPPIGIPPYPAIPRHQPGTLNANLPVLAPQPWVKDMWKWLSENTSGVARVDLRRPMGPAPEQYGNNLLFANYKHKHYNSGNVAQWSPFRRSTPTPPQAALQYGQPQAYTQPPQTGAYPQVPQAYHDPYGRTAVAQPAAHLLSDPYAEATAPAATRVNPPSGARIKITRSFLIGKNEGNDDLPAIDLGGGINIDMDRQKIQPVLRMKIGQILSIKAWPYPCVKLSKTMPMGKTGMGLKVLYEVPITEVHHFYRPPARLMVRLDPIAGSGIRLTPGGIELDQQSLKFGKGITLRASAGVAFPRTLPLDPENDDFGLKVHRLSMKALW